TLMFRYTRIGLRMRAVVESARMTELSGISSDRVSSAGWALSSMLAGMAGVLLGPLFPQLAAQNFFLLIVAAIAAAAFAGLSSLPVDVLLCGGAIVWFAYIGNSYWLSLATQAVIFSIIFLSITVFTGMAGEISLAQGAFAAIGAFTVGQLASRWGVSVFVGIAA